VSSACSRRRRQKRKEVPGWLGRCLLMTATYRLDDRQPSSCTTTSTTTTTTTTTEDKESDSPHVHHSLKLLTGIPDVRQYFKIELSLLCLTRVILHTLQFSSVIVRSNSTSGSIRWTRIGGKTTAQVRSTFSSSRLIHRVCPRVGY